MRGIRWRERCGCDGGNIQVAMVKKDLARIVGNGEEGSHTRVRACDFRGEVRKVERERQELQIRDERQTTKITDQRNRGYAIEKFAKRIDIVS